MPRGDGTGPRGMGSMTGRGMGFCTGYGMPGRAFGVGFGRGRGGVGPGFGGGGRGWRNMFYATGLPGWMRGGRGVPYGVPAAYPQPDPELEKQFLRNQAEALQGELELIKRRLAETEGESGND
jgi:hypothetical protein